MGQAASPGLVIAMRQHRHDAVLSAARNASPSDTEFALAHGWMQNEFNHASPEVQREYVDVVVALIRWDRAPLWRQHAMVTWMMGLTQHQFEARQITDFYAALAATRRASCLRRAWAAVPSLRSWIDD